MQNAIIVANNVIENQKKQLEQQKQVIEEKSQTIVDQKQTLQDYYLIEKIRRNKQEIKAAFNRNVRLLSMLTNKNYSHTYAKIYNIFKNKHNFSYKIKIDIDFISKNIDYLEECLEITLSEINEARNQIEHMIQSEMN